MKFPIRRLETLERSTTIFPVSNNLTPSVFCLPQFFHFSLRSLFSFLFLFSTRRVFLFYFTRYYAFDVSEPRVLSRFIDRHAVFSTPPPPGRPLYRSSSDRRFFICKNEFIKLRKKCRYHSSLSNSPAAASSCDFKHAKTPVMLQSTVLETRDSLFLPFPVSSFLVRI